MLRLLTVLSNGFAASRYEIGGKQVGDYNEGEIERKDLGRFGIWRWSD